MTSITIHESLHQYNLAITCRPWHVAHRAIDAICDAMRATGREELVHYAGACYRDDVAWEMVLAWLQAPDAEEAVLKSRALKAAGWGDVPVESIRATMALPRA